MAKEIISIPTILLFWQLTLWIRAFCAQLAPWLSDLYTPPSEAPLESLPVPVLKLNEQPDKARAIKGSNSTTLKNLFFSILF
jgi:hypothetical protein